MRIHGFVFSSLSRQTVRSRGANAEGALHALARLAMRDGSDPWLRSAVLSSVAGAEVELLSRLRTLDRDLGIASARRH